MRPIYLEDLGLLAALEMLAGEMAQIAGRALSFARRSGYAESDLALLQKLDAALQSWQGAPGDATP